MKKSFYELVKEFQTAFGHPVGDGLTPLTLNRVTKRGTWEVEEVVERLQKSSKNEEEFNEAIQQLKEGLDAAVIKSKKDEYPTAVEDKMIGQIDACVDQLYFIMGDFVELGIEPDEFFEIVQGANMAKLGPDGKVIRRESDGKIMKPAGWEPPEPKLKALLLEKMAKKRDEQLKTKLAYIGSIIEFFEMALDENFDTMYKRIEDELGILNLVGIQDFLQSANNLSNKEAETVMSKLQKTVDVLREKRVMENLLILHNQVKQLDKDELNSQLDKLCFLDSADEETIDNAITDFVNYLLSVDSGINIQKVIPNTYTL